MIARFYPASANPARALDYITQQERIVVFPFFICNPDFICVIGFIRRYGFIHRVSFICRTSFLRRFDFIRVIGFIRRIHSIRLMFRPDRPFFHRKRLTVHKNLPFSPRNVDR